MNALEMVDKQGKDGEFVSECALCGSVKLKAYGTLFESPLANNHTIGLSNRKRRLSIH